MIRFNDEPVRFGDGEKARLDALLAQADEKIREKNGAGNDFLGWIDLPDSYDREELKRIQAAGDRIAESSDVLIVIGIGGSYLGAKAALDFLRSPYYNSTDSRRKGRPEIYFLGNSFSGEEIADVLGLCEGKRVSVNVISKSGTTTEPAIAFRFVREYMESRYSAEELKHRIFATTDRKKGALLTLAKQNGYETFVIPDDIGGRFSVLTAVGLLPLAAAGCDVRKMLDGAKAEKEKLFANPKNNPAYRYAVARTHMLNSGKGVEILVSYDPYLRSFIEWWKQLFGESEGKDGKGIYPSGCIFSTDLHSLGQYIQDGRRVLFETVLEQEEPCGELKVPTDAADADGLNYLAGMTMPEITAKAELGTKLAHAEGGTDSLIVNFDRKDEFTFGALCYFFFIACAASAYMLGVNPFNQPGVEAYKRKMFELLGKPGYQK